jgi:hypothetical protein
VYLSLADVPLLAVPLLVLALWRIRKEGKKTQRFLSEVYSKHNQTIAQLEEYYSGLESDLNSAELDRDIAFEEAHRLKAELIQAQDRYNRQWQRPRGNGGRFVKEAA